MSANFVGEWKSHFLPRISSAGEFWLCAIGFMKQQYTFILYWVPRKKQWKFTRAKTDTMLVNSPHWIWSLLRAQIWFQKAGLSWNGNLFWLKLKIHPIKIAFQNTFQFDLIDFNHFFTREGHNVINKQAYLTSDEEQVSISSTFYAHLFIQKQIAQLFSNNSSALWRFSKRISVPKAGVKCWWNWPQTDKFEEMYNNIVDK